MSNLKKCYSQIINEIDHGKNIDSNVSGTVLMLNKEQMIAGIKKNKINFERTKNLFVDLLDNVRPVCLPEYHIDTRPKASEQDTLLSDLAAKIEQSRSEQKSEFETLKLELETLKSSLSSHDDFLTNVSEHHSPPIDFSSDIPPVDHQIDPINHSTDNFVPEEKREQFLSLLKNLPYHKDKGRSTVKFGENYKYNGSRGDIVLSFLPSSRSSLMK